jgi:hypothetical protein
VAISEEDLLTDVGRIALGRKYCPGQRLGRLPPQVSRRTRNGEHERRIGYI